jgi:hypothetical protein
MSTVVQLVVSSSQFERIQKTLSEKVLPNALKTEVNMAANTREWI